MKKAFKVLLITGSALLFAGSATIFGVFMANDFNHGLVLGNQFVYNEFKFEDKVTSLKINVNEGTYNIKRSEDDTTYISAKESQKVFHEFTLNEGLLNIERKSNLSWHDDWYNKSVYLKEIEVNIYIPYYLLDNLEITANKANIFISDGIKTKNMDIKTTNGNVVINKVMSLNSVNIETKKGFIDLSEALVKKQINLTSESNYVKVNDIKAQEINLKSKSGHIIIDKVYDVPLLNAKSESGYIVGDYIFTDNMNLETTSGYIKCRDIDIKEVLNITSRSGKVDLEINSPKCFNITTNSLNVDVPESVYGNGIVNITTTSGPIRVFINGL